MSPCSCGGGQRRARRRLSTPLIYEVRYADERPWVTLTDMAEAEQLAEHTGGWLHVGRAG